MLTFAQFRMILICGRIQKYSTLKKSWASEKISSTLIMRLVFNRIFPLFRYLLERIEVLIFVLKIVQLFEFRPYPKVDIILAIDEESLNVEFLIIEVFPESKRLLFYFLIIYYHTFVNIQIK